MESKSQAMEKAIDGQYYCQRLLHPDKISSTMLNWFVCFIIFIIGRWIDNKLVNMILFLPPLLLHFLFEHLFQNLFPKYIIDLILSYIYISVCKSILSILNIDFSLVTRNIFHTSTYIYISVSKSILSILNIDFSLVTRRLQVSLISHLSPTQRLTTMEKLSPGSLSLLPFESLTLKVTTLILLIYILNFIGQRMLVSMVKSLNLLSHLSPTPRSTTNKEKFINFLRSPFYFHEVIIFLFRFIITMALDKFFPKYLDTSFFTSADFPSWLHILFEEELINNDTRTETKDIQIKRGEVEFVLSDIGIYLSKEVDQIKDCMSHEEFSTLFDQTEPGLHEVKEAFFVFDQNRDGFIDAKELQTVLINLGLREGTDVNACQSMIDRHDRNRKGKIDQMDFFKLLESAIL